MCRNFTTKSFSLCYFIFVMNWYMVYSSCMYVKFFA